MDFNINRLIDLAKRFGADDFGSRGLAIARDAAELAQLILDNHERARQVLKFSELGEIEAIHAETLAMIDAFDAELARAAAR